MHDAHTRENPTRTVGGIARIRVKMIPWVGVVGQETVKVGHLGGLKEIAKNVIYAQGHCIPLNSCLACRFAKQSISSS